MRADARHRRVGQMLDSYMIYDIRQGMDVQQLQPVTGGFQTKQAMVYQTLRTAILEAKLEPGQRLVIDDIAAALHVSPIPVREALQQLQQEVLVIIRPHAGAVVAGMDKEAIRELFALMEALEQVAVRTAARRIDEAGLQRLRAASVTMRTAATGHQIGDAQAHDVWVTANRAFHREIVAIAGLPLVAEFTERVFTSWDRLRRLSFRDTRFDHGPADGEHDELIAALAAGDADAAEAIVARHNRSALVAYLG